MNVSNYTLWTALITPMNEDGSVDYSSLKSLLEEQDKAGCGLLLLGSTGESLNLGMKDKKGILSFALEQNLSCPLMVGVGGINLEETSEWVSYLETLRVHAYLMVVPLYSKPGAEGQYHWFKTLMDLSTRPVMLYNIPGRTGKELEHSALERLANHPQMWAVKEASGCPIQFDRYSRTVPNAMMFSGDDPMLPMYVPHGCRGLVSVASNAWPVETMEYVRQTLAGELSNDSKVLWKAASESLFCASNPIPVKRLMADEKRISTPILKAPLTHLEINSSAEMQEFSKQIKEWNEGK